MTTKTIRERIGELLSALTSPGTFSTKRLSSPENLHLKVRGLGRLDFPVPRDQAEQLCQLGRPARYGQGKKTLLDRKVRDTWEIPKSRVKIDKRRWNRTLLPMLKQLGIDLGLADGSRLNAEFHSMLVYAPGQFFLPHKDSEKADEMIGTLVVTLPSSFKGGSLIVEHQGERSTYRGSKKKLSFVAFYADCEHEVRTVKDGYRVVLTYNLMLSHQETGSRPRIPPSGETTGALVEQVREYFETSLPVPSWVQEESEIRPDRLVYLLDHEYTERGFSWQRLKGNDATCADALLAVAEQCDCETVLALTDIHEIWNCYEPERPRHRYWTRYEDDWYEKDEPEDPEQYDLEDLVDWDIEIKHCLGPSDKKATPILVQACTSEVCSTTPTSTLTPYASEYEGYMGNYGNTMDRWYRRAAVILWPRENTFALRAEASPPWALSALQKLIRSGQVSEAQTKAKSLSPFWSTAAPEDERSAFFGQALQVSADLNNADLATSLLQPFQIDRLKAGHAKAFVALPQRYGEEWTRSLLASWASNERWYDQGDLAHLRSLPRLCKTLCAADQEIGFLSARLILEERWQALKGALQDSLNLNSPSWRDKKMKNLSLPILGISESIELIDLASLRETVVSFLCADESAPLTSHLVRMLKAGVKKSPNLLAAETFSAIRSNCADQLTTWLAQPTRQRGDWSIDFPDDCRCELCSNLRIFLADPERQTLDWPIAKGKRRYVHQKIDLYELPVLHTTRRKGSPFTMILTKTDNLFKTETQNRRAWKRDLDWLEKN